MEDMNDLEMMTLNEVAEYLSVSSLPLGGSSSNPLTRCLILGWVNQLESPFPLECDYGKHGGLSMENQIIALSYGPDEKPLARTDVMNYFAEYGFQPSEDDTGFMNYGPHKETVFICSVFEKTGYAIQGVSWARVAEPVFAFINQLHDPTTIVSLGGRTPIHGMQSQLIQNTP